MPRRQTRSSSRDGTDRPSRGVAFLGTLVLLSVLLFVQACTSRDIVGVVVGSLTVTPSTTAMVVSDTTDFDAVVRDDLGAQLDSTVVNPSIVWSSNDTTKLIVDADGVAVALAEGMVEVVASFQGVEGIATVNVIAAPEIQLDTTQVSFSGGVGDVPPDSQVVRIGNGGGGTVDSLSVTVAYPAGGPADWLTPTLADTVAPTDLTLAVQTTGLGVGVYTATVYVASSTAWNSPDSLSVSLSLAGVTVIESDGTTVVDEAGTVTDSFTVVLDDEPASDVVFLVSSADTGEVTVAPATLTFTPADWDQPQTVVVTGVDDVVADGNVVSDVIVAVDDDASDDAFDALLDRIVQVTTQDDDVASITVTPTAGLVTTEAGGQATFTVTLDSEPTADVTIGLSSSDTGEGLVSPTSLTFTAADWSDAQTVTVTGVNDDIDDDDVAYSIVTAAATSTDPAYDGADPPDVSVTNSDDSDQAGVTVTPTSGLTTTELGGAAQFTVVLDSEPTANVTIGLSSDDPTEGTVNLVSVVFTPVNWNIPRTVVVTGQDDGATDGDADYAVVTAPATSTDARYSGFDADDVSLTNVDDETAGITVSAVDGPTTEAGGQTTFTIVLNNEPSDPVTIGVTSSDTGEGTVSTGSLTFTPADWSNPQPVTVTGVDDDVDDGDQVYTVVTAAASSADGDYNGLDPSNVSITNVDDDLAGFSVSSPSGPTTEAGGTATFTVALTSEPTGDVSFGVSSSNTAEGTVSPTSLTFTPANWSVPQTVTVTGIDDATADENTDYAAVLAIATSADPNYDGRDPADVALTNVDDETAGISVSAVSGPTTEGGGTAAFSVVLSTQPSDDVTLGLSSSDTSEGTISAASLTFTPANWDMPQFVAVTGVDDDLNDGDVVYTIVTAPATSADPDYNARDALDVSVTNVDDDAAGFVVSAASGPTTETGDEATFTVALSSQPGSDVTFGLSSSNTAEGTVSPTTLTFTSANWDLAQTVTVTGVDDDLADGNMTYLIVTAAASSGDPDYDGLNPDDVWFTNVDDEVAGITVSPVDQPTTENGGQGTFSVTLNAEPTADVTIGLSSSDVTEGTISASSLTFTPLNWSIAQTVTVTGVDDDVDDDNVVYTIVTAPASSLDGGYDGVNPVDVVVANVDDDVAGFLVSAPDGPTTEAGGQATFTVVLTSEPTNDVTVDLSSSDIGEGTVAPASLTFTPASWDAPQAATVTGADDAVEDGNISYSIVTAPAVSSDTKYSGLDPANVAMTNVDDETAGITVSPASGPTTEAGGTATFTVVLNTQPTAGVTIGLTSSDTNEGTIPVSSVAFTTGNWSTPQTVTVTGVGDDVDDGDVAYSIVTGAATSADPNYGGLDPVDVSITNIDDDQAGFAVSSPSGPTTEAGGQATFTIALTSEPTANVTVGLSSSDTSEGTVAPASVIFTPGNWDTPQTVTVTGQNDNLADDNIAYAIVTALATSTDPLYDGLNPINVALTNIDDETAGITISPATGPTTEGGGTSTFTVVLNNEPTATVTIGVSSSDTSEGTVAPTSLVFDAGNWDIPQPVTVTGVNDDVDDDNVVYTIVTAAAASGDSNYSGLDPADVSVTNVDDDEAGMVVSPISGPTTEGGGTATFTVVLTSEPTNDVTIGVSSSDTSEGTVAPVSLTFTPANWSTAQAVTVTGVDDSLDDDNIGYTVVTAPATSADPKYNTLNGGDVSVTNVDDESTGIDVSAASGPTTEAGGTATFTIVLASEPTAGVTIGLSSSDATEGTVSPASVTFTTANWSIAQTVTVTGVDDDLDDGDVGYSIVTAPASSGDPSYDGLNAPDVSVTNNDDESAGITVSGASGPTTEAGGTATFSVVLTSQPTANVTIGLSSNDTSEGTVSPTSVTFTSGDWDSPQTVTVTGVDDDVDDDNVVYQIVTAAASSTDGTYSGQNPADVSVTNIDDETAGFVVSAPSGPTTEAGGTATFTVRLTSEPTNNVAIDLASNTPTEGTASPSTLTFTPGNWDSDQTVTVTGVNDDIADGNVNYSIVIDPATSSDAKYAGLDPDDVSITNVDDESPGINVGPASGPTTEDGGTATFTVVLSTQPTANVVIGVSSNDTGEGTVSPTSLTFTPANWSIAQPVTVTGVDDDVDDGNVQYTVETAAASSADGTYDGWNPDDVTVTNVDDDVSGFMVSAPSGPTTEAGGTATFTVRLTSEPTAGVTIGLTSSDTSEGTVNPSGLTFTAGNWSTTQTVTVTGVNDDIDDDITTYTIVTGAAASTDTNYSGLDPDDVPMTNVDDGDTAGITVDPIFGLNTTEAGGTDQFTIVLDTEPLANVTIGVTSGDASEGTVSPASVTFTPANWDTPQAITATGVNDDVDDDNVAYTIVTSPASSTDGAYAGLDPDDVAATNADDADTAGVLVNPGAGLTTTEAGGTDQFTIVLTSEPVANVTISLSSSAPTEGSVPASVTFTSVNWDTPQPVTVTGLDDDVDDDDQPYTIVTSAAASADPKYNGQAVTDVGATNTDDDTAGISVSPTSGLVTTEGGGGDAFTVVLDSEPVANVNVGISSSDTGEGTVGTASLTFTPANWDTPQPVNVTGVNDDVDDDDQPYTIVTAAATSSDPKYAGINPANVGATNTDNDTAGFTVSAISGSTTEGGGTATFTVVLDTEPTANVSIGISSNDTGEGTVAPATLTFTPANWDVAQTVTATGVNDDFDDGNVQYTIVTGAATSTDTNYSGLDPANVLVTNVDNDTAGISVGPTSGLTTTEGAGTDQFDVVLDSEPTANVSIGISSSNTAEGTVSPTTLTFTPDNWDTPQTVTVTGVDDVVDDGNIGYTIVTAAANSADTNYNGFNAADVSVTNTDDDTAGFTVTPTSGLLTTEAAGTAQFTIVLDSEPVANVTVGVTSSDTSEGTVSAASLLFTPANWNVAQPITVTGVDDDIDDDDVGYTIVNVVSATTDPSYSGLTVDDVSVTNQDDADLAGVSVGPTSGLTTTETAGTALFNVVLDSEPTANVTIGISSSNTDEGTVSPTTLTFTPGDWNSAQTVTVTGVNDDVDDGDIGYTIVTAAASSSDTKYSGMAVDDVSVTNTDDDTAGYTVTPTSGLTTTEASGTDQFSIVLDSEPISNVTVGVTSSNTDEGTVSTATLTFTPADWDTPQDVIVTGVDDDVDDGDVVYTIFNVVSSTTDPNYSGLTVDDVSVTNTDDDTAGLTVVETNGTTEVEELPGAGGQTQDTITVVLDAEPLTNVVLDVVSANTNEATVTPATLTFTPSGGGTPWDVPQVIVVGGGASGVSDGNTMTDVTISVNDAASDNAFDGLVEIVTVTTIDIDP